MSLQKLPLAVLRVNISSRTISLSPLITVKIWGRGEGGGGGEQQKRYICIYISSSWMINFVDFKDR